jgi:hypothetical protein
MSQQPHSMRILKCKYMETIQTFTLFNILHHLYLTSPCTSIRIQFIDPLRGMGLKGGMSHTRFNPPLSWL